MTQEVINLQILKDMATPDALLRDMEEDIDPLGAISDLVWSYLQYTTCKIDGNDATIIEIKNVYSLINDIMGFLKEKQQTIDLNVKTNMELVKTIQSMINRGKSSGFPLI
jgi:hypothetical protein